jgi:GT2 family glycosyltransferase
MNKKLAIILINWNQYDLTKACLQSLLKCNYKNFSIFLVDNASIDLSGVKLNEDFPEITFLQNNNNLGFTGANNVAIDLALKNGFKNIMLLNNDTEVDPDFIEPLLKKLDKNPNIGAIQPLILNWFDKNLIWNFGGKFDNFFGRVITLQKGVDIKELKNSKETDWVSGCCFLIRSEVIQKIGLLDDFFFVYFEDADWSLRIKEEGYSLGLESNSRIYHHEGGSWNSKTKNKEGFVSPKTHYLSIRNHLYFLKKHNKNFNLFGSFLYQIFKLFSYAIYFLFRLRLEKFRMVFKGLNDGLKSRKHGI